MTTTTTITEDFEDDSPPDAPDADFYDFTSTGTGSFRTTTSIALGTVAYQQTQTTGGTKTGDFDLSAGGIDLADQGRGAFAFRFVQLPDAGTITFGFTDTQGSGVSRVLGVTVTSVGVLTARVQDNSATTDSVFSTTVSSGTWYNLTITNFDPSNAVATFYLNDQDESVTIDGPGAYAAGDLDNFQVRSSGPNTVDMRLDDFRVINVLVAAPVLATASTVAVTGLRGFDVDPTGTSAIARTNIAATGSSIQTFVARTLTAQATDETFCNSLHKVLAGQDHVAYVVCDPGAADEPTHIFIKKTGGAAPGFPECGSSTVDECGGEIPLSGFSSEGGDGLHELGEMDAFPISGARTITESIANGDRAEIAWVFGSDSSSAGSVGGKIGADALFLFLDGSTVDVLKDSAETDYTNQAPVQICSWGDPSSTDAFVAAADSGGGTTRVFRATVGVNERAVLRDNPDVSVNAVFTHSGAFAAATGLGCGNDKLIIQTNDSVSVVGARNSTVFWTRAVENTGISRGVGMDPTGNWVAYYDDGDVAIANATTGTVLAGVSPPSGTLRKVELDNNGQNLWIATDDEIAVYETFSVTTITPVGTEEPPAAVGPSDDLFDTTEVASALGITSFGANLLFGAILIGLVSFGVGTGGGAVVEGGGGFRFSFAAAGIGALIGFLVAWGFGFFTDGTVFVIVVLSILILGAGVWFRR